MSKLIEMVAEGPLKAALLLSATENILGMKLSDSAKVEALRVLFETVEGATK